MQLALGNTNDAIAAFEKAKAMENNDVVKNNLGMGALAKGELAKAEEYFTSMTAATAESKWGMGVISITKGEYDKAAKYMIKDSDVNSALAKMMTGNNGGALEDLEAYDNPNCFMKEYLKAVIGARTARENLLFESLEKACKINPDMKAKASNDMEFAKYFENPKFREITK